MEAPAPEGRGGTARPVIVLTVAGSDSGGGAGIQADLKTISMLGCYGTTVITALTAQNSVGVQAVHTLPAAFVESQLDSVLGDLPPAAAKTGMLAEASIVAAVAGRLRRAALPRLVVDPVMISATGHRLIDEGAVRSLVEELFPLAAVVTPNLHEASALLGREIDGAEAMEKAARDLCRLGARAVLLKGGHLAGEATDCLCEGGRVEFLSAARIGTDNVHGSGCTLSAAIASYLGRGLELAEAVARAKAFITRAIAASYRVGSGPGPVNPLAAGAVEPAVGGGA